MQNNVVVKTKNYLCDKGLPCAIFNFRGVGKSTGEYDNCRGEQEDLKNVIQFIQEKYVEIKKIILIGYSFGAVITLAVANSIPNNICTILIAYPFEFIPDIQPDFDNKKPILFLQGEFDDITNKTNFERNYSKFKGAKQFKMINSDHFFIGSEHQIGKLVFEFIELLQK
jgi:alpha/beta superfamily hydrolase